MAEVVKLCFCT